MSLGYSNKIDYRNKAKNGDDIYVTGNIGDSYIGLKALQNKIKLNSNQKNILLTNITLPIYL